MKNIIFTFALLSASSVSAQDDKTLRIGIQWGFHGTHTEYSGGMPDAHARFEKRDFGGAQLAIVGRYDFNRRWMLHSGLSFNTYGFEFAIAENYSLLNKERKHTAVKSEIGTLEIPLMLFYKFNPNCKNARWLIGAGFANGVTGAAEINKNVSKVADASNINYLSSATSVKGGGFVMLRWSVAREKLYRNGSILNASVIFNAGLNELAKAKVNYTIDNQNYSHEFRTNGNYVGFRLAYYWKPLNARR